MTELSPPSQTETPRARFRPSWWWLAPLAAALILLYYPVGMLVMHEIDDDPEFAPPAGSVQAGQSRAVAVAALLVRREVDTHRWTANDPFFQPSWALDDMPSYQQGIVAAVSRFVSVMAAGGDRDLEKAAGLFKYPGTVWMFDPSTSWAPTASAEKQYRLATRWLDGYNARLAGGDAVLDRGPGLVRAVLGAVADDLGAAALATERMVAEGGVLDGGADDLFHATKGRLYAHRLILRELGWDHAQLLSERELGGAWREMLEALATAALLDPPVVVNGAADSALLPAHPAGQGFHLLRARDRVLRLLDALAK
ncbi:MAG: DUF2333 domain-containing protein [Pseudomonadota bacterium]